MLNHWSYRKYSNIFISRKRGFYESIKGAVAGIGSAGLYENGMDEASVLKVREYLAAGLPVIVPTKILLFLIKNCLSGFSSCLMRQGLAREKRISLILSKRWKGSNPLYDVIPYVGSKYWEAERVKFMEDVLNNS